MLWQLAADYKDAVYRSDLEAVHDGLIAMRVLAIVLEEEVKHEKNKPKEAE